MAGIDMFMIQPYGICVVTGIISAYCVLHARLITLPIIKGSLAPRMINACLWAGLIGARLLYYLELQYIQKTSTSLLAINSGGVSSQGAILGVLLTCVFFVYHHGTKAIKIIDCIASCAPLIQSIARIGCLIAGCCYGVHTTATWAITYTNSTSLAPTNIPLHPTQLYSSLSLLCAFALLQLTLPTLLKQTGLTTTLYLFLSSLERFMIDFLRGDHTSIIYFLSLSQCIALICGSIALIIIVFCVWGTPITYERISKN